MEGEVRKVWREQYWHSALLDSASLTSHGAQALQNGPPVELGSSRTAAIGVRVQRATNPTAPTALGLGRACQEVHSCALALFTAL